MMWPGNDFLQLWTQIFARQSSTPVSVTTTKALMKRKGPKANALA